MNKNQNINGLFGDAGRGLLPAPALNTYSK
jgi:hypothetical protein